MMNKPRIVKLFLLFLTALLMGCTKQTPLNDIIPTTIPELADCIPANQMPETAVVIRIVDGDTIVVMLDRREYNLRYIGIDAPEFNPAEKSLAEKSTSYNTTLVEGQRVFLYRDTSETDRFNRLLRYVYTDDIFVNYELVRSGMARARDYPPDSACKDVLNYAERLAKKTKSGIWSEDEMVIEN